MRQPPSHSRGASNVEYSLLLALIVVTSIGAIGLLGDSSADYLSTTGDDIGEPRPHIEDMSDDLPDPPAWINP